MAVRGFLLAFSDAVSRLRFCNLCFFCGYTVLLTGILRSRFAREKLAGVGAHDLRSGLFVTCLNVTYLVLFSFTVFFCIFTSKRLGGDRVDTVDALGSAFRSRMSSTVRGLSAMSMGVGCDGVSGSILSRGFSLGVSSRVLSTVSSLFVSLDNARLGTSRMGLCSFSKCILRTNLSAVIGGDSSSRGR